MPYSYEELKNIISPIARRYGLGSVRIFGSYSKGTANAESDIDLVIEKGQIRTLFQISSFRLDLEDALKIPVDLITTDSEDKDFLNMISEDEVLLYECAG